MLLPDGFPLAYEVMDGNTSGKKLLQPFLDRIEKGLRAGAACVGDGSRDTDGSSPDKDVQERKISYLVGDAEKHQ